MHAPGSHDNNERCSITVLQPGWLHVVGPFDVQSCCDGFLLPNRTSFANTVESLTGVRVRIPLSR
jgi:hypothetical protein